MRSRRSIGLLTLAACALALSCRDATAPDPAPCDVEGVTLRIDPASLAQMQNGSLRPRFDWTPACGAGGLIVERVAGESREPRWVVEARSGRTLRSGLRYGFESSGASTLVGAFPIGREGTYRAVLYRLPDHVVLAMAEFGT